MFYNCTLKKKEKVEKREREIEYKGEKTIEELSGLKELSLKKWKIRKDIGYYIEHSNELKKINEILIMHKYFHSKIYRFTPMEI